MSIKPELPPKWKLKPINDICKVITGNTPSKKNPQFFGGRIPFFKPIDLNQGFNVVDSFDKLSKLGLEHAREIPEKSTLITCIGTIGKTGFNRVSGATNQQINSLIPDTSLILPELLYYWCISPVFQKSIIKNSSAVTLSIINKNRLSSLTLPIPPLKEQKRITSKLESIFSQIDEKKKQILALIENNRKRIDFFEKNLFSYVIDREIEHHPERKNWEIKKIKDVCQLITSGGTPKRNVPEYFDGDIPWVKIGDLNNGLVTKTEEKISESGLKNSSAKLFPIDTVLFGMYGGQSYSSGITGIAKIKCTTNQAICGLVCNKNLIPSFLLYFLQAKVDAIRSMATGGAQLNLNQNKIKNFKISLPPLETQQQIVKNIESAEEKFQSQKQKFENIKNSYESTIKYIKHMQSSILDVAFSGKLVPQDPDDEPAEILLEKIKKKK